jgi:hypothetical protein
MGMCKMEMRWGMWDENGDRAMCLVKTAEKCAKRGAKVTHQKQCPNISSRNFRGQIFVSAECMNAFIMAFMRRDFVFSF